MRFGIIGHPLKHSISPRLFNEIFNMMNLGFVYEAFELPPEDLETFINFLRQSQIVGINVTLPFKEKVCDLLDWLDPPAKRIRAVNTIHKVNDKLCGYNTDYYGFSESIKEFKDRLRNVLIFGGGGAARAVLYSISQLNYQKVFLVERSARRREKLQEDFGYMKNLEIKEWEDDYILETLKGIDFVVNTTPLGMEGFSDSFPLKPTYSLQGKVFMDLVYKPELTPFLKIGQSFGAEIKNGVEMLIFQAIKSLEIWTDLKTEFKDWQRIYHSIYKSSDKF